MPARSDGFVSAGPWGGPDAVRCTAPTSVMDCVRYFSGNGKFDPACSAGKWRFELHMKSRGECVTALQSSSLTLSPLPVPLTCCLISPSSQVQPHNSLLRVEKVTADTPLMPKAQQANSVFSCAAMPGINMLMMCACEHGCVCVCVCVTAAEPASGRVSLHKSLALAAKSTPSVLQAGQRLSSVSLC